QGLQALSPRRWPPLGAFIKLPALRVVHDFLIVGMWTDLAMDAQVIGWVRELWGALQPFSSGGLYVNYEAEHDRGRVQAAYSPAKYARLAAVKATYDPTNLFRLNQNIPPAG